MCLRTQGNRLCEPVAEQVIKTAIISEDGLYRYDLQRIWGDGGLQSYQLPIIMLNPSTADANVDDPTIRRCITFAKREGYGGIKVANLFAFRATSPQALRVAEDPIGPENNSALNMLLAGARQYGIPVLCAWGANGNYLKRDEWLKGRARQMCTNLIHLGLTKEGHPMHPLYVPSLQPFGVLYP